MDMNDEVVEQQPTPRLIPSSSSESSPCMSLSASAEELEHMSLARPKMMSRKRLCKQLSMCETPRDVAWEKRRRQILQQERKRNCGNGDSPGDPAVAEPEGVEMSLTDEDLHELKGCIELGFGFNEEEGQRLCPTLPALDLYFAVNRQLSPSPVSSPNSSRHSTSSMGGPTSSFGGLSSSFGSPSPRSDNDGWKVCSPGDNPQQVKTKLRHWAQAVACSVMQSY